MAQRKEIFSTTFENFLSQAPEYIGAFVKKAVFCLDGFSEGVFEAKAVGIADESIKIFDSFTYGEIKKEWINDPSLLILFNLTTLAVVASSEMCTILKMEADAFNEELPELLDRHDQFFGLLHDSQIPDLDSSLAYSKKYRPFWAGLTKFCLYTACIYYRDMKDDLKSHTVYDAIDELLNALTD